MSVLQKKICLLGAFAVGKTSLVSRFVHSRFSEKYLTTVGVKIDKKLVTVDDKQLNLIVWDLHGEDHFQQVRMTYMRGAAGYLLVADGTRKATLETAKRLQERAVEAGGQCPFILLVNKSDLPEDWEIEDSSLAELAERGWIVSRTSAKTGAGVEDAFERLAREILASEE